MHRPEEPGKSNVPAAALVRRAGKPDNAPLMTDQNSIQGISPGELAEAWNATELGRTVRRWTEERRAIVDYGTAHHGLGHAPPADYGQIRQSRGVIDHYVPDMTVRARAATPLGELAAALAEQNQWLPIDGADEGQTLGEMIAHNVYGPLRLGYGSMRDLLLGLRYMDSAGEEIAVGGRTVKNVAGYDLTRYMVGSLNTLGVLTEATLRTYAIPPQVTSVQVQPIDPAWLMEHLTSLLTSDASPTYLDMQVIHRNGSTQVALHIGYAGSAHECDSQYQALGHWAEDARADWADLPRQDESLADDQRRRLQRRQWRADTNGLVKLILRPRWGARAIATLCESSLPEMQMDVLPAHGVIWLGGKWNVEQALTVDRTIDQLIRECGGMRQWLARPNHSTEIRPFAPLPHENPMLEELRRTLDPAKILNPGRFA
jgi:glycolate oxidase FAD binding subunit